LGLIPYISRDFVDSAKLALAHRRAVEQYRPALLIGLFVALAVSETAGEGAKETADGETHCSGCGGGGSGGGGVAVVKRFELAKFSIDDCQTSEVKI